MPTIDVDLNELESALHLKLHGNMEKLDEILANVKAEVKAYDQKENTVSIEMKDTNRPDLWSVEGLSRALSGFLGIEKGPKIYTAGKSAVDVYVDEKLWNIRPYICCSVLKDIHLSDNAIKGIMHLQDKLDQTYGRNRQKTSIGIYNFDLIKPPIKYTVAKPSETSFVPLGFSEKMTLAEILERHPKGAEHGYIVKKHSVYPMLFDSQDKVLSFPPIINSVDLGKITEESRNLLVEVTGTSANTVLNTLNLVTMALIDHQAQAYNATIHYPQNHIYPEKTIQTPDFAPRPFQLSVEYTNRLLGLQLSAKKISELLLVAGLGFAEGSEDSLTVLVPSYRIDVMHQVDIIEDVAVAYGYNNIEPLWREMPTTGKAKPQQRFIGVARELMAGLGYQEILNYTLTNQENMYDKMNMKRSETVELSNPKVATMTCLRSWLLPSIIEFLSINQSVEFPQKIFELGKITRPNQTAETCTSDQDWLAAVTTHVNADFSEIKSALDSFMTNFGIEWEIKETVHPSFIEGRVGSVIVDGDEVGLVGEINPQVLENWKLENPMAALEINFQKILKTKFAHL